MPPPQQKSLLAGVEYEQWIALILNHDAEWSRNKSKADEPWFQHHMDSAKKLKDNCDLYRQHVVKNYQDYCAANQTSDVDALPPFLFDPIFYLPLGHSDLLSLILVDDFDPIHYLTGRMTTTLESAAIAFLPKLTSLGVNPKDPQDSVFHNLKDTRQLVKENTDGSHPFFVFCKLKMDSLCCLGIALSIQIAIWRAMIVRIRAVVAALRVAAEKQPTDEVLVEAREVDALRCSLIDLQGCEEIGLLIFCNNLSAAFALVGAIRALTYGDLYAVDPELPGVLARSRMHEHLAKLQTTRAAGAPPFAENHIFRWSHSAVSLLPEDTIVKGAKRLFPDPTRLQGQLWAVSKFQVLPGHFGRVFEALRAPHAPEAEAREPKALLSYQYLIGLYDTVFDHARTEPGFAPKDLVKASALAHNLETTLHCLCITQDQAVVGRDVVEFETEIAVPVPRIKDEQGRPLLCDNVGNNHFAPLSTTLPKLRQRLFYFSHLTESEAQAIQRSVHPYKPGSLDIPRLMDAQRRLGIPVSLRRSIEYLFQNFAIVASDPFSFDVVLDLYDTFATLHAVLTEHLFGKDVRMGQCESWTPDCRRLLDEGRVRSLAHIAEALHCAMSHRLANAFRDPSWRDMAVDFRGGLNQVLFAADAPVKCGLGVVRRFLAPQGEVIEARNSVGCVMQISMLPGARCGIPNFGVERSARLAFFDVDVPHVLHVPSYADFLHEAFHVVYSTLRLQPNSPLKVLAPPMEEADLERFEEIFALTLWRMFVFAEDTETYVFRNVLAFSRSISSFGNHDSETWRRFVEVLLRLFLSIEGFSVEGSDPRRWKMATAARPIEQVWPEFEKFVKKSGPFFSEYERIVEEMRNKIWQRTQEHFAAVYPSLAQHLPIIWRAAHETYQRVAQFTSPGDGDDLDACNEYLNTEILEGLQAGRPILWHEYAVQRHFERKINDNEQLAHNMDGLGGLHFVCKVLYGYLQNVRGAECKSMHLLREEERAKLGYATRHNWWEFQADKGAAALFSCVPSARGKRILKEIVILKSFWHLASELRARRFVEMLACNGL